MILHGWSHCGGHGSVRATVDGVLMGSWFQMLSYLVTILHVAIVGLVVEGATVKGAATVLICQPHHDGNWSC